MPLLSEVDAKNECVMSKICHSITLLPGMPINTGKQEVIDSQEDFKSITVLVRHRAKKAILTVGLEEIPYSCLCPFALDIIHVA